MRSKNVDMLSGSITKGFLSLLIPIMIMNVMQSLFQIVDMITLRYFVNDTAVGAVFVSGDMGFAGDDGAVLEFRDQAHIGVGDGQDAPGDGKDFAHTAHGFIEAVAHIVEGGEEEVAETLSGEAAFTEAVSQQGLNGRFGIGQSLQTVADIARRKHTEFLAQDAGAAAVIRNGDDGGEVCGIFFQTAEHGGQACAAADGDGTGTVSRVKSLGHGQYHPLSISRQMSRA